MRCRGLAMWFVAGLLIAGCSGAGKHSVSDAGGEEIAGELEDVGGTDDARGMPDTAQAVDVADSDGLLPDLAPTDVGPDADAVDAVGPPPCASDADCGFCESCDAATGQCLAIPCPVECEEDSDCAPGEHCETLEGGCCGQCVVDYPCLNVDCLPTCATDSDCPPGHACVFTADGCCSACESELMELEPLCAHAPSVVQAGESFAVAVYGLPGCSTFDHHEVTTQGASYQIKLYGTASSDPDCPPLAECAQEAWSYLGLIWLDAPDPGVYTVQVGDDFTFQVGASGGIIGEPACNDDCALPALENYLWSLKAIGDPALGAQCINPGNPLFVGAELDLAGSCQDFTLGEVLSLPEIPVKHCTDGHLLFGSAAPYWMEGRVCGTDPMVDGHLPVILGTIQDSLGSPLPPQFFLVEGIPLWN